MRRIALAACCLVTSIIPAAAQAPAAQSSGKKVLSIDDYTKWRTIESAQLSPDGKWASYGFRFANTTTADSKPVLHIRNLATSAEVTVPDASQAAFSPDSRWIVYQVDPAAPRGGGRRGGGGDTTVTPVTNPPAPGAPPANPPVVPPTTPPTNAPATPPAGAGGRGGAGAPPAPIRHWELRELATGKVQSWQDILSASFSPTSSHVLLRRRPPGAAPAAGGGGGGAGNGAAGGGSAGRGTDAILHDLATNRSQFLGSVGEASFNRSGDLLAYTVDATVRDGNGLFLINLKNGRTDVLDNDTLRYNRLTWNDRGTALAILKGREVEKMRERNNKLLVFPDVTSGVDAPEFAPTVLDPATAASFPKGFVVSERAPISWSDDSKEIFLAIMPQSTAPDTAKRKSTDSLADVDVWTTHDERIQSVQMTQIDAERNRSFRQGFVIASGKYVTLSDSGMRELDLPLAGHWAIGRDPRPYISDYKPAAADIWRVNTLTGERTKLLTGQLTGAHTPGLSPDGQTFLYWKDAQWQAWDLNANASHTLAVGSGVSFVDMEEDHPGVKPSYGIAGYTIDGKGLIAQHRFDLWLLPLDGAGKAVSLTGGMGTRDKIVYRYLRTEPIDSSVRRAARVAREIDLSKPITLSTYGEYTKKAGFSRLADGKVTSLVFDDAAYSTPQRAAGSDIYLLTRQTFSEFPDLVTSSASFTDRKKITDANPQQAEFLWGHRVLFDFVTRKGDKLQGILALPDDYKPGEKRPMIVTFYEKNSQTMNRYPTPSYVTGMGAIPIEAVSRGYITMLPDVKFHTGSSHSDMLDAVEAATLKVIAMGYADPKHIGVHGHSYGGEGAAFIGTRSRLFAAVGMGAGVTDLYTDFNQSWGWSYQVSGGSGDNGNNYYMIGQGRWGFSPWEKPEVYHFESALTHVPEVTAPFLIMHGTADPTVSFSEGMNFYNALRYNGKNATLLAYTGEGHGLRGLANRKDLTIRYFQFFDHYLKGTPAPKWMTDGVPFIIKDQVKEPK